MLSCRRWRLAFGRKQESCARNADLTPSQYQLCTSSLVLGVRLWLIKSIASTPRPQWSAEPCLHFLNATIQHILFHVLPTDPTPEYGLAPDEPLPPAVVWRFRFVPRRGVELYRVDAYDECHGRWGGVLPEEYVRWRMSRR